MAKTSFWSRLLGTVRFTVEGGATERFLNECMAAGLSVSRVKATPLGFSASLPARQYKSVHRFAHKCRCRVRVQRRIGLSFHFYRYHKRAGIACGLLLFLLLCWWMQGCIWTISYYNLPVETARVLDARLYEAGIVQGMRPDSDALQQVRQKLLLANPEFASLSLHFIKGRLLVEATLRNEQQTIIDNTTPMDIVADRAGVLESIEVYSGYAVRWVGQAVAPGDLIVSHSYTDERTGTTVTGYSRAKIRARTTTTYRYEQPYQFEEDVLTGQVKSYCTLHLGSYALPLFRDQTLPLSYEEERHTAALAPMGWALPALVEWRNITETTKKTVQLTPEAAENRARYLCQSSIATKLADAEILAAEEAVETAEDRVTYSITVTAIEEIGTTVAPSSPAVNAPPTTPIAP